MVAYSKSESENEGVATAGQPGKGSDDGEIGPQPSGLPGKGSDDQEMRPQPSGLPGKGSDDEEIGPQQSGIPGKGSDDEEIGPQQSGQPRKGSDDEEIRPQPSGLPGKGSDNEEIGPQPSGLPGKGSGNQEIRPQPSGLPGKGPEPSGLQEKGPTGLDKWSKQPPQGPENPGWPPNQDPANKVKMPKYLIIKGKVITWERNIKKPKWAKWLNETQWESHKEAIDETFDKIFEMIDKARKIVGLKPSYVLNEEYVRKVEKERNKLRPQPPEGAIPDEDPGHGIPTRPQTKGGPINELVLSGIWVMQNAANSVKTFLPQTIQDMWTLSVKALGFAQTTESLQPLSIAGTMYAGPQSNYVEDAKKR